MESMSEGEEEGVEKRSPNGSKTNKRHLVLNRCGGFLSSDLFGTFLSVAYPTPWYCVGYTQRDANMYTLEIQAMSTTMEALWAPQMENRLENTDRRKNTHQLLSGGLSVST
ncbi:hypothetical protein RRG08_044416 [Elysia crispata]|uniref:Uncharacterized protein n=1 Tax=Elysia crispata TaxID=231223 RepID=A0AAE0ZVB1_9GAST|nr:hypothetical protein RRG08_044416 [Elysia crispata]